MRFLDGQMDGDIVTLRLNGVEIKNIPVFIQPGHIRRISVSLALGYEGLNQVNLETM